MYWKHDAAQAPHIQRGAQFSVAVQMAQLQQASLAMAVDPSTLDETDIRSVAHLNPKQQRRIVERRKERRRFRVLNGVDDPAPRGDFVHKSRHEHACKRKRGPGGRFLPLDQQPPEVQTAQAAKVAAVAARKFARLAKRYAAAASGEPAAAASVRAAMLASAAAPVVAAAPPAARGP